MVLNDIEEYIKTHKVSLYEHIEKMIKELMILRCQKINELFGKIMQFICCEPRLPDEKSKNFIKSSYINISPEDDRESIKEKILNAAKPDSVYELALYAYRDMDVIDWTPFLKASIERNPVSIEGLKEVNDIDKIYKIIDSLENVSIYDGKRLALPDEVWNFSRGDGVEKAILLLNVIHNRFPSEKKIFRIDGDNVELEFKEKVYKFHSSKNQKSRVFKF